MRRSFKSLTSDFRAKAWGVIITTPIEVAIGAVVFGYMAGAYSYLNNRDKEATIPLAFSEISATTRHFESKGLPVPPLTRFYSVANDTYMQVFEANDIALKSSRADRIFAQEIEYKMDRAFRIHTQIPEYAATIRHDAAAALHSLDKLTQAEKDLPAVINALDKAWDSSHNDVYHTEFYTTESCDSKNQCTTETHTRQVYDYTIHSYSYNAQQGKKSVALLNAFNKAHPDLKIEETLYLPQETHVDNEYAQEKSMKHQLKGKIPTPAQALANARRWATGSDFAVDMPLIAANQSRLLHDAPAWEKASATAKSTSYITYSHFDSGPKTYQTAEQALTHAQNIYKLSAEITNGIRYTANNIPALADKIENFIHISLDNKSGNSTKARREVMQISKDGYNKIFKGGFDVQPFKWSEVLLFTLGGILLGGGIGFGVDRGIDYAINRHPKGPRNDR